jgi:putative chitinase
MSIQVSWVQIVSLAPKALPAYQQAFASAQAALDRHGISSNALRVAHFMAQVLHESGGLTLQSENLNYSAARLVAVWPSRFKPIGVLDPAQYAKKPQALANQVYGGRMGNNAEGDGYKYRGRGLLQLTGKDNYFEATKNVRKAIPNSPDFTVDPDLLINSLWCVEVAAAKWEATACNPLADQDNIQAVTLKINGGTIGLQDRSLWLARCKTVWHS